LLLAHVIEGVRRKKRLCLALGVGMRLPYVVIGLALLLLAPSAPGAALAVIVCCMLVTALSASLTGPPWTDVVAETVPQGRIGSLFSFRRGISAVVSLLAGPLCGAILARFMFPHNYAALYGVAVVFMFISLFVFSLVDDVPAEAVKEQREPMTAYLRRMLGLLREDGNYRSLLLFFLCGRMNIAAIPFYAIVAIEYHGVDPVVVVSSLIVTRRGAMVIGALAAPRLARLVGNKAMMQTARLGQVFAALALGCTPAGAWPLFLGAVFFSKLIGSAGGIAATDVKMRSLPRGHRVGYQTMFAVMLGTTGLVTCALAGRIMDSGGLMPGHRLLFILVATGLLLSLWPLRHVEAATEPVGTGES
jgi:MFS family permease